MTESNQTSGAATPPLLRRNAVIRHPFLFGAVVTIFLAIVYWGFLASDRYVTETHLVIDRTDSQSPIGQDFASILSGSRNNHDLLFLRDHIRSVDMLQKLEGKLALRAHYSNKSRDLVSRLSAQDAAMEDFHKYFQSRVTAEMDELAGVLRIRVEAFDPVMARNIAVAILDYGEAFVNEVAHKLAREQVEFLEQQVTASSQSAMKARKAMLDYQNTSGLLSPQLKVDALASITARLESQLSELKSRRAAMLGYLSPDAADVVQANFQVAALEKQLAAEQSRLASPKGGMLNTKVEEFQRLEIEAGFAQDVYKTSLAALERGRVDAVRMIKKLTIVQSPHLPEKPLEPRRLYNVVTAALAALVLAAIGHLVLAIVRDHQD